MHCSCGLQIEDRWWACSLDTRIRRPLIPSIVFHVTARFGVRGRHAYAFMYTYQLQCATACQRIGDFAPRERGTACPNMYGVINVVKGSH